MKSTELKVGDRVRIIGLPKVSLHEDTVIAYEMLFKRGRSVRIDSIDEYGKPWFYFKYRTDNGRWGYHSMAIFETDDNWVPVKKRK